MTWVTIGYHRNYSGRWLVATMSASKSTSLMRDFTSLPEFDLMFMFAVKSYLHSWCFQCSSRPISKFLTVFACHGRHLITNRNCLSFPRTGVNDIHSNYDMGHGGHLITNRNCLSFPRTGVNDIHSNYDMGHGGHLITNRNCLSFPRIGVNAPVFGWSPCCSSC